MAVEKDQAAWLPEAAPPRPARREAAIEAALRKFDRVDEAASTAKEGKRRSWSSPHRPRLAVFASAMLLLVVGIPAALIGIRNTEPPRASKAPPRALAANDSERFEAPQP